MRQQATIMRFMRITTNYAHYLKQFYRERLALARQPYATQYQALMEDGFGWADFWTHALQPFGYEVWEPVANAKPMQLAWAREHSVRYGRQTWLTDILAAQVKFFQPEILFAGDSTTFPPEFLRHLRQECPSIKLILGWCAPADIHKEYKAHDLIFSNVPAIVTHLRTRGHRAEYLKHAFEPRLLKGIIQTNMKKIPFSFIGSIFSESFHNERELLVQMLLEKTPLEIWSNVYYFTRLHTKIIQRAIQLFCLLPGVETRLPRIPVICKYAILQQPHLAFYARQEIAPKIHQWVFGQHMFQILSQSIITLNHHGDHQWNAACNMRMFEATGVGTCLLTDWKENLPELFEPDREVVTYRSLEECQEKVNWLLTHPQQAAEIARAGQARTLREHTFAHRAEQLHNIIHTALV